ncbi:hypothetical protein L596_002726 [Steinernema carpocapsae]|uniref:G-protein coupled receptors family 1 profile domain-containing protein n=1 Tax=Steinernema carpocapsae TaxID=34508 RepID=A0A4V6I7S6_STECR|nr:hypothetical protein L596_002726 [Steinernema carpocapsae]
MNSTLSAKNAEEIYHHTAIFVVHCFVAVLNLMGIFTTAQVTGLFIRYKVFHVNLRILFTNLAAQLILRALCTTFRSSKFIYNSLTVKNFSTVVETERECATKAALFASFHETSIFSFVALSIERVWATVKYEKYERQSGWYFRVFLVIASWIRVYYTVYYIATYDFGLEENVPYCISINSKGIGWDFLCYCFLPLTLISGVMFTFVYLRSKTTNRYIPRSLEILFLFQETHPPQPHSQLSVPTHGEHPDLASRCSLRHHLRHPCSHQRQLLRGSPKIQRPLLPAQPHLSESLFTVHRSEL